MSVDGVYGNSLVSVPMLCPFCTPISEFYQIYGTLFSELVYCDNTLISVQ